MSLANMEVLGSDYKSLCDKILKNQWNSTIK